MSSKSNRRKFLLKTLKAVVPISMGSAQASADTPQKIKLMTSDGQIVEMDQELLEQVAQKSPDKTTRKEILNWTEQVKTKSQPHE